MFGNTGENRRYIAISVVLDESDDYGYYKKNFGLFTDIEKIIIKNQACVAFFDIFNFAYILSFENETNEKCIGLTLDIADLIKEHMAFSCLSDYVIGVGNPVADRKSIRQSLSSAQNAASYSFYLGKRNVIYISDIEQNTEDISIVQRTCHNIIVNLSVRLMQCGQDPNMLFDKTLYEIAHDVGYKTAQHFSVVFKKLTGLTPSAFQSEHKHV